jgi:putative CRISPR-associated protein (TIGR02619 family)
LQLLLTKHANAKTRNAVPPEERQRIESHIEKRAREFERYSREEVKDNSAELNGVLSFYGESFASRLRDIHYLLVTDTWFGEETAGIIRAWLIGHGFADVRVERRADLQTADWPLFRSSLSDLVKWCDETIAPHRSTHYRVIFNLSGGFKSETGFLQTLGMFYADETVYMFERSGELMRIPRLPVRMEAVDEVRNDLRDFRRAAQGLGVSREKSGICWFELDGEHRLTPWGELVFGQHKAKIYQEKIHPAPSDKIVFAEEFLRSCEKEDASRRQRLNEQIDLLARYLENGARQNLNRLSYKQLTHPPYDGVTHEFYSWSDQAAERVYCQVLGENQVELLFLGEHL